MTRHSPGTYCAKLAGRRRRTDGDGHVGDPGADNPAHGRWGEQKLVVRLAHQERPTAGSTLWLHLAENQLHLLMVKQDNEYE